MGNINKKNKNDKNNTEEKLKEEELAIDGLDGRKREKALVAGENDTEKEHEIHLGEMPANPKMPFRRM